MRKKMLVTGSGGMVGHYVKDVFDDFELIFTDISGDCERLDVRNEKDTRRFIIKAKPNVVLHLAAATDVDKCEENKEWAYACNSDGTRNIALACKRYGVIMIYISSGSVFSGKIGRPARETDEPDPVNVYGKSKLAGEKQISSILDKYLLIRAGWMMGGGLAKDKKFIGKIMGKILAGEKNLIAIDDKFGSPVYARNLLFGIKRLLSANVYGIFHMVNGKGCSRYDITTAIKEILKRDDLNVEPVPSERFHLAAPRAFSEELENFRLKELGLDLMKPWKEALREYLEKDWKV